MLWKREPVLFMSAIQASLGLLVAFGLQLSAQQVGAVVTASAAVLSVVTRRHVAPTVPAAAANAVATPVSSPAP